MTATKPKPDLCPVHPKRMEIAVGDICLSYSVDEITGRRPVRAPFEHASKLWICTDMRGCGVTSSGLTECEAYRLSPLSSFNGDATLFKARAGTKEAKAAAEADPNGLYHGVIVRHGRVKSILCGPPVTFVARELTKRRKREAPPPTPETPPNHAIDETCELPRAPVEATSQPVEAPEIATCTVPGSRLQDDAGDITASYSADRIGMDQPLRRPFKYDGALWICSGITGSGLTVSGCREHEAYRLVPERLFIGPVTTYNEKTGTADGTEDARRDSNGFYHGMKVKFAAAAFVMCGPPVRFVAATRPGADPAEPAQLSLF